MLDTLSNVLSLIIIFAEIICCVILSDVFMTRREVIKNKYSATFIEILSFVLVSYMITRNIHDSVICGIMIIISYSIIIHVFYKAKLIVKIGISIIFSISLTAVDSFSIILIYSHLSLPLNMIIDNPLHFFLSAIFSKTILFLIIVLVKRIVGVKRQPALQYVSKHHWFVYILQSVISVVSLLSLIELSFRLGSVPYIVMIAGCGLLFLNIAVFGLLEGAALFGENVRENALLRQQMEVDLENISVLSKAFDSQIQQIHDYKHQISTIYQLISDENYKQALDLMKSISDDIYLALYRIKTNHDIIDAILNQKYLQANNRQITLDIRAGDLSMVKLPDNLLVTIISNIIDNAIEACEKVITDKIVTIKIVNEDGILIFSVINPVSAPVKIENSTILTTKTDKLIHGIGLKKCCISTIKM